MEGGGRGTKPYTKRIQAGKPNTGQLHRTVWDGPLYGPVGATNHTLSVRTTSSGPKRKEAGRRSARSMSRLSCHHEICLAEWSLCVPLLHVRVLVPIEKGLLPRFLSRCCSFGTKVSPFSSGSGHRGHSPPTVFKRSCQGCHVAGPFNTSWYYQPVLKSFFFVFSVHLFGSVHCLYIIIIGL